MATNIPPLNLSEVVAAVTLMIDNPEASVDDIMQILPGPDFPTAGIIMGTRAYVRPRNRKGIIQGKGPLYY
jgi:DNA gyrase subunit A